MDNFALDDWNYTETAGKYVLTGWKGSSTESDIYIPGEYDAHQISLANLTIFPTTMITLRLQEVNNKKVGLETTTIREAFYLKTQIQKLDLSGLDTSQVTDMSYLCYGCSALTHIDLSGWDTRQVTDMTAMFYECSGLTDLNVSSFNTSQVTTMTYMFTLCSGLTHLDVSGFDTSQVTNMNHMFGYCSGLSSLDVSMFDTSRVTDMGGMFCVCTSLTHLDVSGFDTSQVTDMSTMFAYCSGFSSLDLSMFDTSRVTNMENMFSNMTNLKILDFSQCVATTVPASLFEGQSDTRLIVLTPSEGIKKYPFSSYRQPAQLTGEANGGTFDTGLSESASPFNYVYDNRDELRANLLTVRLDFPTRPGNLFKYWEEDCSFSDNILELLWNQANAVYTAQWFPAKRDRRHY